MTSITPSVYQAVAIKHGLKFYAKHKKMINRMYTPSAMMRTAEHITGAKFKARDYYDAIDALTQWIEKQRGNDA